VINGHRPPEIEQIFVEMRRQRFCTVAEAQAWLDRRMSEYNAAPQAALAGLSPLQVAALLSGDWVSTGALRTDPGIPAAELAGADFLEVARLLLLAARDEGPLPATATGNLSRRTVAALLERMPRSPELEYALEPLGVVRNEQDLFLLHVPRVVLGVAGLLIRRKGFRITRRGRELLEEARAGELFAELFRTHFRGFNLAYLSRGPEEPGIQRTVAVSLFLLGRHAGEWAGAETLAERVLLPDAADPTARVDDPYRADAVRWLVAARLLHPLRRFGLLERRLVGEGPEWQRRTEFRKTPLFDRFLRFEGLAF
jgi:hypothetical protein